MAYAGEILELGDLVPERRPVAILRDGERVVLMGYVDSPSCPARVVAGQQGARRRWLRATTVPDGEERDEELAALAWADFVRATLMAVVPGLEYDEADVIAGNPDRYESVLRHLEWWKDGTSDDAGPAPEADGESPSTGDGFSPSSTPSTAAGTG